MVHIASQFGQLQMLNYLLNIGVEHGAVDKSGQTPLHLVGEKQPVKAAKYRSPNLDECSVKVGCERRDSVAGGYSVTKTIVARLVDAGADVMVPNMSGQTPIEFWLHRGEHETALVILKSICKTVKVSWSRGYQMQLALHCWTLICTLRLGERGGVQISAK